MLKQKAALFWSGGKDSAFTLYTIQKKYPQFDIVLLVTTVNQEFKRISMHGVREEMLDKQGEAIGIPLQKMRVPNEPTNSAYEKALHLTLSGLKESGIDFIVFGDIFLEDLKEYRDRILKAHDLTGVYPLWKKDTSVLIKDFISSGFHTITCCINNAYLPKSWLGKEINKAFINDLPEGVDPCGENGEFHTFCFEGPIFNQPITITKGEEKFVPLNIKTDSSEKETGFWYIDLY
ncbi:MAG TPA: diphthine--ammonia ligase [Sphingobacteriaceae bacterium]|nr:diphthine--ammonia ligase [Sphingobacteriaceae bacterium]